MKNKLTVSELATKIVGDGKKPNKWFITLGYGWYFPKDSEDMVQVENSMESITMLFTVKSQAEEMFNSFKIHGIDKVTGETIGQVTLEDRLNGVVKEKNLRQLQNGAFFSETI